VNLLKSSNLRRTGTVVAGAVLGLLGLLASTTPALACKAKALPDVSCVNTDGSWTVKWKISNAERIDATVKQISVDPGTVTGIKVGDVLTARGELQATHEVPAGVSKADLTVWLDWAFENNRRSRSGTFKPETFTWTKPRHEKKCTPPTTTPTTAPTTTPTTEPTTSAPTTTPTTEPTTTAPTTTPTTEPTTTAPTTTPPTTGPTPTTPPTQTPVEEPQYVYDYDCETFVVGLEVPASWDEDVTVTFTPSTGAAKTVVAKRGETTTVEFPASAGLSVKASPEGYEDSDVTINYEAPADCDTGGEGGGLPITGSNTGAVAGTAALLLAAGGVLFFMARRRKLKFTA
jgi:LPXTG-motif cell wall-anchored protein